MHFASKLSPDEWAEARRLRAGGATYTEVARRFGMSARTIRRRADSEGWPSPARAAPATPRLLGATGRASPATASIRSRLALRLYRVIDCKIRMMELRMIRELQAHERAESDGLPPPAIEDERESFAALIDSINQVTEMASDPAPATDGRRRAAAGPINPELTALSSDIDTDGLAVASAKDQYRRELAEHLGRMLATGSGIAFNISLFNYLGLTPPPFLVAADCNTAQAESMTCRERH
jgi:transposase-like protein